MHELTIFSLTKTLTGEELFNLCQLHLQLSSAVLEVLKYPQLAGARTQAQGTPSAPQTGPNMQIAPKADWRLGTAAHHQVCSNISGQSQMI